METQITRGIGNGRDFVSGLEREEDGNMRDLEAVEDSNERDD